MCRARGSRSLIREDPQRLAALWNDAFPAAFRVTPDTIKRNLLECDLTLEEGCLFTRTGFAVLKQCGTPKWFVGQDPANGHISALASPTEREVQDVLLPHLINSARKYGIKKLLFGMDPDHILPGCPEKCQLLKSVLLEAGFKESGQCFDLERDLRTYTLPMNVEPALSQARATVSPCRSQDLAALDGFLAQEFPSRWRHDVMRKAQDDGEPSQISLLWIDNAVEGFALTQHEGCKRPIAGAVWSLDLGPHWAALGPIGISKSARGKGLGNALLGKALESLSRMGSRQTIIDWTTLADFYGSHGFQVTRRYSTMALDLS